MDEWRQARTRVPSPSFPAEGAPPQAVVTPIHVPTAETVVPSGPDGSLDSSKAPSSRSASAHHLYSKDVLDSALSVATGVLLQRFNPQAEASGSQGFQLIMSDIEARLRESFDSGQPVTMEEVTKAVDGAVKDYRDDFKRPGT